MAQSGPRVGSPQKIYVGRVGMLATVLGIGLWVGSAAVAVADTASHASADASPSSASSSEATAGAVRGQRGPRALADSRATGTRRDARKGDSQGAAARSAARPRSAAAERREARSPLQRSRLVDLTDLDTIVSQSVPRPAVQPSHLGATAALPAAAVSVAAVDTAGSNPVASAPKPSASASVGCRNCWILKSPVATAAFTVERVMDLVGTWLSILPANPITEFLSGSLWLARRTLFPVGTDVGLWGSAECIAGKDCTGQDLTGADLSHKDLTDVKFNGANLTRVSFGRANLTRADLRDATLNSTRFVTANLTSADLTGANLSYQDLSLATLAGSNLTNANLVGARLWGPTTLKDLSTATLVGTDLSKQNLAGLNLAGKDMTGAKLGGANLTGADLSRAKLTGAEMAGVNLTRANLTDATLPGPSWASPLVDATLVGANLTNVDLSGADLSGKNLTGTVLVGAKLLRTRLNSADLTGADLTGAILTGADLTAANLTRTDLWRADLSDTTLTGVRWRDTRCQYGGTTNSGCSNVALLNQPPAEWLETASDRRPGPDKFWPWQWYQYGGPGVEPALDQKPAPILRGTPGAPLVNAQFRDSANYPSYPDDGIQGMLYNDSGQRVVVRVPIPIRIDGQYQYYWSTAVLDPGDSVPYQLAVTRDPNDSLVGRGGTLQFLRYDNGQTVGDAAELYLEDPYNNDRPKTQFTPPGRIVPANTRYWNEQDQHSEVWGGIDIQVRREIDGWQLDGSETYLEYYKYTKAAATSDWAIFTIRIKGI